MGFIVKTYLNGQERKSSEVTRIITDRETAQSAHSGDDYFVDGKGHLLDICLDRGESSMEIRKEDKKMDIQLTVKKFDDTNGDFKVININTLKSPELPSDTFDSSIDINCETNTEYSR